MLRISITLRSQLRWINSSSATRQLQAQTVDEPNEEKSPCPFKEIPEPSSSIPILGTVLDYSRLRGFKPEDIYDHFRQRHKELGPIFKENVLPGLTEYSVYYSDYRDTSKVLKNEGRYPHRDTLEFLAKAKQTSGQEIGISQSQGEDWLMLRRVANKFFLQNESVWAYTEQHQQVADDFAIFLEEKLDERYEVLDLQNLLKLWSLEASAVFNLDTRLGLLNNNPSDEAKQLIDSINISFELMTKLFFGPPFWRIYKTKTFKDFQDQTNKATQIVLRYFRAVVAKNVEKGTKLHLHEYLNTTELSPSLKESIILDFFGGGIDTTANSAVFPLYLLANNPDKQEKLREEIQKMMKNNELSGKRLNQLPYFHSVMQEAQRMFPFSGIWTRKLEKDVVLSNYHIPSGIALMNTSNLVNALNPEYFENPQEFIPERWLDPKQRQRARFAMIGSFGHGARKCPGRQFALQEIHCLLIAILTRYRLEYHHDPIEGKFKLLTIASKDPRIRFVPLVKK